MFVEMWKSVESSPEDSYVFVLLSFVCVTSVSNINLVKTYKNFNKLLTTTKMLWQSLKIL